MTVPILQPAPLDIVPADAVAELIERTQQELAELERQASASAAAAEEAERRPDGEAFDPAFNVWAVDRLDRLVAAMREDHEAEMQALLAAAEQRARACVDRAHVDADTILSYARALRAGDSDAEPVAPVPPIGHGDPPRLTWRPDEAAAPEPAPEVVPPAPAPPEPAPVVVSAPPVVVTPPTVVPPAPAPFVVAPAPEPVMVTPPAVVAPAPAPEPVVPVPVAVAPPPPPPAPPVVEALEDEPPEPAPVAADAEPGATENAAPETGLKGLLARMPTFAILQVLAVIVVLIIVLIKIG